jgi:hypothetical protein
VREKSREPKRGKSESRFLAVARGGTALAMRCLPHKNKKQICAIIHISRRPDDRDVRNALRLPQPWELRALRGFSLIQCS